MGVLDGRFMRDMAEALWPQTKVDHIKHDAEANEKPVRTNDGVSIRGIVETLWPQTKVGHMKAEL
jgi:hypothetical protein